VPHGTTLDSGVAFSGFALLRLRQIPARHISARRDSLATRLKKASEIGHLKRSFSSPPVASAQTRLISARRDSLATRLTRASKSGGREPKVRPAASRERSNTTHLSPSRFTRDEAGQSEQKRRSRTKGSPRRQSRALQSRTSPSSARAGTESRRECSPCPSRK
jgi:hypothetical protein